MVEPPDNLENPNDLPDLSDIIGEQLEIFDTFHENNQHICAVLISEDPLNFAKTQIHITIVKTNPNPLKILFLFKHSKQRFILQLSEINFANDEINFIKETIVSHVAYCTYFTNDKYETFSRVLQDNFNDTLKF